MKFFNVIAVTLLFSAQLAAKDPKLSAEEIISRHLAAIGPPEARAAITSRIVEGQLQLSGRLYRGSGVVGAAKLVTDNRNLRLSLPLSADYYRGEDVSFDGHAVRVKVDGLNRSPLSEFLDRFKEVIAEGYLGGVLSTDWSLLDSHRKRKFEAIGHTDFEGRQLLRLERTYGNLEVRLYFDPQTFRHVRTRYWMQGPMFEERFDNFQVIDGVTLPTKWQVRYKAFNWRPPNDYQDWQIVVLRMKHNEQIQPQIFKLGGLVPELSKERAR